MRLAATGGKAGGLVGVGVVTRFAARADGSAWLAVAWY